MFVWLHWVLVAACKIVVSCGIFAVVQRLSSCGLSSYGIRAQLLHNMQDMKDLSSLTMDQTCIPHIARQILNHWTTKEVPSHPFISLAPCIFALSYLFSSPARMPILYAVTVFDFCPELIKSFFLQLQKKRSLMSFKEKLSLDSLRMALPCLHFTAHFPSSSNLMSFLQDTKYLFNRSVADPQSCSDQSLMSLCTLILLSSSSLLKISPLLLSIISSFPDHSTCSFTCFFPIIVTYEQISQGSILNLFF